VLTSPVEFLVWTSPEIELESLQRCSLFGRNTLA